MQIPLLAQRVFGQPLLLQESKLRVIESVIGTWAGIELDPMAAGEMLVVEGSERRMPRSIDGVAVIDIFGTLVHRTGGLDALSGLTSYQAIRSDLEAAMQDPGVVAIVLNIDSPGGEVAGVFELADRIREASLEKPILAYAHDLAASAAYALASAAGSVYLAEAAAIGSIGVVMAHLDQSAHDERQGVRVTHLHAGARKIDGNPHEPLADEARQVLQAQVNQLYEIFVAKVAANRDIQAEQVKATEAGIFIGDRAVVAGLADGVASSDEVLELAIKEAAMGGARRARLEEAPEDEKVEKLATEAIIEDEDQEDEEEDAMDAIAKRFPVASAQLVAQGVATERERITGLLSLVKRPGEMQAALAAVTSGKSRGDLAADLLSSYQEAGQKTLAAIQGDCDQAAVASAPAPAIRPLANDTMPADAIVAVIGDDDVTIENKCKTAWDASPKLRSCFKLGGYAAFRAWNKLHARGGGLAKA
jgi:signal peptide peptidase SppA